MRIFYYVIFFSLLVACQQKKSNKRTVTPVKISKVDTAKFMWVVTMREMKNSSLVFMNDTAFLITRNFPHGNYLSRFLTYNSDSNKLVHKTLSESNHFRYTKSGLMVLSPYQVYLKSLNHTGIKYLRLPKKLIAAARIKTPLTRGTKVQFLNGKYYFVESLVPQKFNVYDTLSKKLTSYDISGQFMEITDLLLYDLDRDGSPEIFLFNIGNSSHEEVIDYDIYTIRKDSLGFTALN